MFKKASLLLSVVILSACGPSPAPPDQSTAAAPPPGAAPAAAAPAAAPAAAEAPAAAPAPAQAAMAPPPPGPSAADQELARIKAEQRKLARQQAALSAQQQAMYAAPPPPPPCMDCGVVASVIPVTQQGQAGVAGTLGGAAAGGLIGNQFGKGKGNTAMTVVGVLGGALAGRAVEQQVTSTTVYQIAVNMEAGGQRMVTLPNANGIGPGTRVHVYGDNSLQPY